MTRTKPTKVQPDDFAHDAIVVRTCAADGGSHNGFKYPLTVGAIVACPDWQPTPVCGNGLHGLLNGIGDWALVDSGAERVWQVIGVLRSEVVAIDGDKVKFPRGKILYSGSASGAAAWFVPEMVGGGDQITQRVLAGGAAVASIPLAFLLRFALGAVSYAAATPGGLFAPMLVLGAQLGFFCGALCRMVFPDLGIEPEAFAVVGMAAFFTGVVQAPVTGIVLVIEMTAGFTMLLPMLGACFAAMLMLNLLHSPPIYESLRERIARQQQSGGDKRSTGK